VTIDTLFLDAGGVLVFPNWTRVAAALAGQGVEVAPAALAAVELAAKHEVDTAARGQPDLIRGWLVFERVLARAGVTDTPAIAAALDEVQRYHSEFNLWEHVPDEVVPALRRFRAAGLRLVVVSNANGRMRTALERMGLAPHVDLVVDSHEEGVEKPDPRIFAHALARIGARADRTLHVGDLYHTDVVGARRAGLRAVLLDLAGLYHDHDCERVASLAELADRLAGEPG